ncbi:MAG: MaoC family dehydratase [Candidatus Methylomirabilales bacterium]
MSEKQNGKKKSIFSKAITREDFAGFCHMIGLDDSSLGSHVLHPLLETFAAGSAWEALSRLTGSDVIPLSSKLDFGAPIDIGDTITAVAEAEEQTDEGILKIHLLCRNQREELVLEGWAFALPPESLDNQ